MSGLLLQSVVKWFIKKQLTGIQILTVQLQMLEFDTVCEEVQASFRLIVRRRGCIRLVFASS